MIYRQNYTPSRCFSCNFGRCITYVCNKTFKTPPKTLPFLHLSLSENTFWKIFRRYGKISNFGMQLEWLNPIRPGGDIIITPVSFFPISILGNTNDMNFIQLVQEIFSWMNPFKNQSNKNQTCSYNNKSFLIKTSIWIKVFRVIP